MHENFNLKHIISLFSLQFSYLDIAHVQMKIDNFQENDLQKIVKFEKLILFLK